ncbi:MAG: DUF3006 family protein [Gemmatimonadota bacterium]|nr:MAG: DUF3006 family protein [Gemmatimonadota bacterium]
MSTEQHYAVDRIRHRTALLVDDEQRQTLVPTSRLPRDLAEGQVLLVPVDEAGTADWGRARIDEAEGERRRVQAEQAIEELKRRDPGGDVEL